MISVAFILVTRIDTVRFHNAGRRGRDAVNEMISSSSLEVILERFAHVVRAGIIARLPQAPAPSEPPSFLPI
jgi:hypothetical protein